MDGASVRESTWEPAHYFVARYCYKFVEYLQQNGLHVGMAESLKAKPSDGTVEGSTP